MPRCKNARRRCSYGRDRVDDRRYFRHNKSLAQFTNTCARSVEECIVLLGIQGVSLFGFAVAFFVGYGGSLDA